MPGLAAVLMMGGRSRRMGRQKAHLPMGGGFLWERQYAFLSTLADPVFRSVAYSEADGDGVLVDKSPSPGPLAGIAAALSTMAGEWLLVLAVDIVGVTRPMVEELYRHRVPGGVVQARFHGQAQPLLAVWHRDVRPMVHDALARDRRAVREVLERVPVRIVDFPAVWEDAAAHLNTPRDLDDYERRSARRWLQVVGFSGSGKTTVLAHLLTRLQAAGESAVVVKVSHHAVQQHVGLDTRTLLRAGAQDAWLLGSDGLFREGPAGPLDLLPLASAAWLLVEGGRGWATPKVVLARDDWPSVAPPVLAAVGRNPEGRAPLTVAVNLPDEAQAASDFLFAHRLALSVPLSEIRNG